MAKKRDYQRSKVYRAQGCLLGSKRFEDLQVVQAYCDKIINSQAWKARWPNKNMVLLKDGRGTRTAWGRNGFQGRIELNLPKWARTERTIIHELAHGVTPTSEPAHGHVFCGIYLEMVGLFIGKDAAEKLRQGFVKYGVDYGYNVPVDKELPTVEIEADFRPGKLTIHGNALKKAVVLRRISATGSAHWGAMLSPKEAMEMGQALIDYAKKHGKDLM